MAELTEGQLQQLLEQRAGAYNAGLTLRQGADGRWCALISMHFDPVDRAAGKPGTTLRSAKGPSRHGAMMELVHTFTPPPVPSSRERR